MALRKPVIGFHCRGWPRRALSVVVGVLLLLPAGCGRGTGSVAGRIDPLSSVSPGVQQVSASPVTPALRRTTLSASAEPACEPGRLVTVVTSDRAVYAAGDRVILTVSVRNTLTSPCGVPTGTCIPQVRIIDPSGMEIYNRATMQVMCSFGPARNVAPGSVFTQTIQLKPGDFSARRCPGKTASNCGGAAIRSGVYRVNARWSGLPEALASFRISP